MTTTPRTPVHRLQVATTLHQFVNEQVLPGTGVNSDTSRKDWPVCTGCVPNSSNGNW